MDYRENNRKIALFLDWTEQTNPAERWFGQFFNSHGERMGGSFKEPLLFHSDWNWLMLCLNKIYSSNEYYKYIQTLGQFSDGIQINTKFIDSTYEQVIQFIDWYDEMKM